MSESTHEIRPGPTAGSSNTVYIDMSRRAFALTLLGAGIVGTTGGYLFSSTLLEPIEAAATSGDPQRRSAQPTTGLESDADRIARHVAWAQTIATGSIDDFVRHAHAFMIILEDRPEDPSLWRGVIRLSEHLLAHDEEIDDRTITPALLGRLRRMTPPPGERAELAQLRTKLVGLVR